MKTCPNCGARKASTQETRTFKGNPSDTTVYYECGTTCVVTPEGEERWRQSDECKLNALRTSADALAEAAEKYWDAIRRLYATYPPSSPTLTTTRRSVELGAALSAYRAATKGADDAQRD